MSQEIENTEEVVQEEEEQAEEEVEETKENSVEETTEEPEEESIDWEARAKKAEALIQKNKKKPAKKINNNSNDSETLERMQLQLDGYPKDIVDQIMDLGGKGFLANEVGKKVVDEMVKQRKAEVASEISDKSQAGFEQKFTPEDLEDKSVEELEKILPKADEL